MENKTLMDKINQGRQFRSMKMECRATEENTESFIVEGYATTFNEPYVMYDGGDFEYREQVDSLAFDGCDMDDVIFQYDHAGRVFARCSNKTLNVNVDAHGLFISANLGGTEEGRKLYTEIKGGYTTKMSFGFTVKDDKVELIGKENGKDIYLRTIMKFSKIYDVSSVSLPANDGTEISARAYVDGVIAKRNAEKAIEEQKNKEAEELKIKAEEQEKRERARKRALAL